MRILHFLLSIIAFCLVIICCAILNIIPSASAKGNPPRTIAVPVNPDGSITVRFALNSTMDVNIDEIGGRSQSGGTIAVNVDEIDGHSPTVSPLKVDIDQVGGYGTYGTLPVKVK